MSTLFAATTGAPLRNVSTHSLQNVRSKEQIIASSLLGGTGLAQFSQMGRTSSIVFTQSGSAEVLVVDREKCVVDLV